MKVSVRYMAQARHAAGVASEQVELPEPCSVRQLLTRLAEAHGEALRRILVDGGAGVQPALLLFLGDEQVPPGAGAALRDGDMLTILAPMAGG